MDLFVVPTISFRLLYGFLIMGHGRLQILWFEVAQSSVAKYMVKRRGPPSQGWRTFLRNHASDIAAMDLFVVPTIGFDLLYAFVIVRLGRRDLVWITTMVGFKAFGTHRQFYNVNIKGTGSDGPYDCRTHRVPAY
jgi:hypothetical protein